MVGVGYMGIIWNDRQLSDTQQWKITTETQGN